MLINIFMNSKLFMVYMYIYKLIKITSNIITYHVIDYNIINNITISISIMILMIYHIYVKNYMLLIVMIVIVCYCIHIIDNNLMYFII